MAEVHKGIPEADILEKSSTISEQASSSREVRGKRRPFQQSPKDDRAEPASYGYATFGGKKIRSWATREELDRYSKKPITDDLWKHVQKHARQQDELYEIEQRERKEARAKAGFIPQPDENWERFEKLWANNFPPEEMEKYQQWWDENVKPFNERVEVENEKRRQEKEKLDEETLNRYEKARAELAAMTPEERAAFKEKYTLKKYTDDEIRQLLKKMHANNWAMERKRAAWLHDRDPRYDPLTGDLLESDEHPLSPTSEYYFDGSSRPRRFVPGDSPHLDKYKRVAVNEEDVQPESDYHERLVQRLLIAGFVEVEPTLADKASFEQTQWYRNLSPYEKMQLLQDSMQEMKGVRVSDKKNAGEIFGELFELLIDCMIALISPEYMEKKYRNQTA